MRGRLFDPEEGPKLFDGNKLHFTMPFKGRRFTAIFFQIFPALQQFLGAQGSPARLPNYRILIFSSCTAGNRISRGEPPVPTSATPKIEVYLKLVTDVNNSCAKLTNTSIAEKSFGIPAIGCYMTPRGILAHHLTPQSQPATKGKLSLGHRIDSQKKTSCLSAASTKGNNLPCAMCV